MRAIFENLATANASLTPQIESMSIAVLNERFILTAKSLNGDSLYAIVYSCKLSRATLCSSGGRS